MVLHRNDRFKSALATQKGETMKKILLGLILVFILIPFDSYAEDKKEKPLTKEQLEELDAFSSFPEQMDILLKQMEIMTKKRLNNCLKAFGDDKFCGCLNDNLPVGVDFQLYIASTIFSKDELKYKSLSETDKTLIDNAVKIRNLCVNKKHGY